MLEIINQISTYGTLIILFIAIITLLAFGFFYKDKNVWLSFVKKNALNLYLILLIPAVIVILYYSEVALFTPCKLCWFQRMFIFPQILLIFLAKYKKDLVNIWTYLAWMTGFAFVISLLHNYIYYFGKEFAGVCDASASCTAYYVSELGFVTIPFMAFGLLVSLSTILIVRKYYKGNSVNLS
ncbi:hypothetical protein A3C57_02310 [Candidatus Nomurabacteria bacterium RIFCSPHIGHO2_02_FULL_33_12]|uniref:Disulfide bond formation protein DsbB n=1 Tax=Candidatus Nomurabacteria bacterium RIFCSPLOWO2_01_FULL_33_17 TaxID=1801764 RepID=A0A1F6WMM3_9BACT|nr:MAG: hypothetical protein A3C57_02310 [Candidatus Nomurabacteria bacterium RIFCSPHIGHO2_02_FULL_33_12]OGI83127.1 MAG: hypothetical protein A2903_01560 [Candidatus Nomurabacteria bacterium RIFCSPLOWO2_01_FULL_33_17]